jgi:Caspase domain
MKWLAVLISLIVSQGTCNAASNTRPAPDDALTPELRQVPRDIRSTLIDEGHALLIGIARYAPGTGWSDLRSVQHGINDLLAPTLRPHFNWVQVMLNPTIEDLKIYLESFLQRNQKRLFIYYAGHGFTTVDTSLIKTARWATLPDIIRSQTRRPLQTRQEVRFQWIKLTSWSAIPQPSM